MNSIITEDIKNFGLFCGIGAGLFGMNSSKAEVVTKTATYRAAFRCIGGIDVDPCCIENFSKIVGVDGTLLDLFTEEQYTAWHGNPPPANWRAATIEDIRRAAGYEFPNILFTSPPCKGFSGLLATNRAASAKYQALNALTLRGVWLALEAFKDNPPEFVLLENVPRIMTRGGHFLDQIQALLESYGYAVARTTHCCGELGGLAQKRRRFLLVGRQMAKVPPFLYEPEKRSLRSVGDILNKLPMPGDERAGPMHCLPALAWKTWVRLALIEPGKDWRSLNQLDVKDGFLKDFCIVPDKVYQAGVMGVKRFTDTTGCVTGRSGPTNGAFSVADPRYARTQEYRQFDITKIHGQSTETQLTDGQRTIPDPRLHWHQAASRNKFKIVSFSGHANTVIGATKPADGAASIADPRPTWGGRHGGNMKVCAFDEPAPTVIGGGKGVQGGHISVSDVRENSESQIPSLNLDNAQENCGYFPAPDENLRCEIRSQWNTWHRPFTTYELAALQNLFDPDEGVQFELSGKSDRVRREVIGNAVPPGAAAAIGSAMGHAILLARSGQTFALGATPIWVRPTVTAISVDNNTHNYGMI